MNWGSEIACCSKVILSGVNGNVIMSGYENNHSPDNGLPNGKYAIEVYCPRKSIEIDRAVA